MDWAKEMNNQPVAWMDYLEHSDVYDLNVSGRGIPLYTHPVKELTDEELYKVYADLQESYTGNNFPVDLGRAILRKAQDK